LWHGANWAFVFWGFLHGMYLIVQRLFVPYWRRFVKFTHMPRLMDDGIAMLTVFVLTMIAWVYFRAGSLGAQSFTIANKVLSGIASLEGFSWGAVINKFQVVKGFLLILILFAVELTNFKIALNPAQVKSPVWRMAAFVVLLWLIAFFGSFGNSSFIYFQF
jgi:alginate O-acetyltransferase complex protein AlgI